MITAKFAFAVKHLHHKPPHPAGLDGRPFCVDNCIPPIARDARFGGSKKKMSTMSLALWQRGCERLAAELPEQQFNTWIRPLVAGVSVQDGVDGAPNTVILRVPNRFKLDWIRAQYANRIEAVLTELSGAPVRLELAVTPSKAEAPAMPLRRSNPVAAAALAVGALGLAAPAGHASVRPGAPAATLHRLNAALTFDTLVPGRANQMARTAALHVAGAPGAMYNPLFIYGGVGLGKTHLVHAVGNALLKDKPDARVLYLHAEQFISDVVKNYQRKTFDELKAKYHSLDLLLIEDRKSTRLNSSHQ